MMDGSFLSISEMVRNCQIRCPVQTCESMDRFADKYAMRTEHWAAEHHHPLGLCLI
jgi:hypothetical protein